MLSKYDLAASRCYSCRWRRKGRIKVFFCMQGKEVACNIIKMPSGTVVFEDVNPEMLKGQVLKPLERGANVASINTEPLSGRLRYRGRDRSEVEIPFGDKDQKGEYTLR